MLDQTALEIDLSKKTSVVSIIKDSEIIGPIDYGLKTFQKDGKGSFCFGMGSLADSMIPGTKRLIFTSYSPLWDHFYISTMGGAAKVFSTLGVNYVKLSGKTESPMILSINRIDGFVHVEFHSVNLKDVWHGYKDELGIYALQQYVYDNYSKDFKECRILTTGPSALMSNMGAIASAPILKGEITPVDCWAGRGGLGSKLLQDHNIAAVIYGGDFEGDKNSKVKDIKEINKIFDKHIHKVMIKADMEATNKYRYVEAYKTGGTLGVNFTMLKGWMFSFNYQSVNLTEQVRIDIHKNFVLDHYLKQFNEESIEKKQFKHCGEPCGAVCKKMNGKFKKDYEPYQTLGPNSGIFDQRAAEKANHYVDSMGYDAIQMGATVSWIMECLSKGIFPTKDLGLDKLPKWDYENFDIINDSNFNADLAVEIMKNITYNPAWEIFTKGIRHAAKQLDLKYNTKTIDLAVYNSFGDDGCMVPNQYWVPGMFAPMPIMGKYFEYYGADYISPFDLGKKNVERMVKELYSDNGGICRFHRKWVEEILGELINDLYDVNIDIKAHHKKLAQLINWNNKPVFWESERIVDIIWKYLEKILTGEPENQELTVWVEKFRSDKWAAAKEYWEQLRDGMNSGFE